MFQRETDDFDSYSSDAALAAAYPANAGGDPIVASLAAPGEYSGRSMKLSYTLGSNGYAGVIHNLPTTQDWRNTAGLQMWVLPGGDGQVLTVQFVADGAYWESTLTLNGTTGRVIEIPFSSFAPPSWAPQGATLDLSSVTQPHYSSILYDDDDVTSDPRTRTANRTAPAALRQRRPAR